MSAIQRVNWMRKETCSVGRKKRTLLKPNGGKCLQSIFYMHRPDLQSIDIGDLNSRIRLRRDLKCKSFQWYLDEVIPEKFIPTDHAQAYGRVTNVAHGKPLCLDYMQHNEDLAYDLGLYPCHAELSMSQFFVFSKDGRLRREESCAQVDPDPNSPENPVQMVPCPLEPTPEQKWILTKVRLRARPLGNLAESKAQKLAQFFSFSHVPKCPQLSLLHK